MIEKLLHRLLLRPRSGTKWKSMSSVSCAWCVPSRPLRARNRGGAIVNMLSVVSWYV